MGTKIFAKVGLAVLLLALPAISNEIAAAADSAIQPASTCIPDPNPNNERPGGGGKIATLLPALVWNPRSFTSGDSLYQTLLRGGYGATLTTDLAPFVDSLPNYHLFVIARGAHAGFWDDFQPFADVVLAFLQGHGSLYWEGANEIADVTNFAPGLYEFFQVVIPGGVPGPADYLVGATSALYGDMFADIDSLVTADGHGAIESFCNWPDAYVVQASDPRNVYLYPIGLICRVGSTRTMTAGFSWDRINDSGANTRVDLINDVMEWLSEPVNVEDPEPLPKEFSLALPYPNPFNAQTTIEYALPRASNVRLQVYDITGRVVATIASGIYPAGYYRETWDAKNKASGVYFVRLVAGEYRETKKVVLLK